ncbi:MAG TPA: hypothetical protein VNG32_00970 [Candidatus Dormibacteraeota bacterium]|nr:hypothetical protein [Candidatus Dormibacteraeota bacterium]
MNNPLYDLGHYATSKDIEEEEKREITREELSEVVGHAHEPIFRATTVFPFTLFPDTVTIDRTKLTVTHRVFFRVAEIVGIRIEDILNVTANIGPFFGSILIHTRFFDPAKPHAVNYLKREDALRIDRIMHGYSIALEKGINCAAVPPKELAKMLDELGHE